jgi:uroporphyrinogen III methyltransferase/synthase
VVATLSTIVQRASAEGIGAPAITVIGWTVILRDEISWFDKRPLFGQTILVTRASAGGSDASAPGALTQKLRDLGAQVVEMAATRIVPIGGAPLAARLAELDEYAWIVFTSANAVDYFWRALAGAGRDTRALAGIRVAAVGPATAAALLARGVVADAQATRFAAEGLLEVMAERTDVDGAKILYPCAEGARTTLELGLQQLGAVVDRVHTYRSAADGEAGSRLKAAVESGEITIAVFTSASGVRSFARAVGNDMMAKVAAASIGPVTSAALLEAGIPVAAEADEATMDGVARAIVEFTGGAAG